MPNIARTGRRTPSMQKVVQSTSSSCCPSLTLSLAKCEPFIGAPRTNSPIHQVPIHNSFLFSHSSSSNSSGGGANGDLKRRDGMKIRRERRQSFGIRESGRGQSDCNYIWSFTYIKLCILARKWHYGNIRSVCIAEQKA